MKENMRLVLGVILAVLLLAPGLALAGNASGESDIELAKEIAQAEVAKNVGDYPQWEGAEATGGQPYCNLEGDVICYWFAVSKEGKVLGSVVVGSSLYEHAIFQVGSGSPPSIPTADEVSSSVEKCLGLEITQKDIGEPLRLVYVTYSFYFAIYDIDGQLIGIDLVRKEAVPASELMMVIASPEQYRQYKEGRTKPLGGGKSLNLSVPLKYMNDSALYPGHRNNSNCGPTSGSMIVVYHKNVTGYTYFDDWPDCHSDPDDGTGGLYNTMKCNQPWPGVFLHDAGPGWVTYAEDCGYENWGYAHLWAELDSYEDIKRSINQEDPVMILFWVGSPYNPLHWCVIKGYEQDGADQICINDPHYFSTKLDWGLHYSTSGLAFIFPGEYATLRGRVSFVGRGEPPNNKWREKLEVRFFDALTGEEMAWSPKNPATDSEGYFTIDGGIPAGAYDIGIKNWTCLSELETGVVLFGGEVTEVDFGTTREGDANNDDWVDMADLSLLLDAWNTHEGDPKWDPHCDFNRDGWVTMADLSLMLPNWNQHGDLT